MKVGFVYSAVVGLCVSSIALAGTPSAVDNYIVRGGTDLQYKSAEKNIIVKDVVGEQGENSKLLVRFNGGAALFYENVAGGAQYDVYFTLVLAKNTIRVDCVFLDARSGINGALVNKAVCGLDKKLDVNYVDLASVFSDKWVSAASKIDTRAILDGKSNFIDISDATWSDLNIIRRYKGQADLTGGAPDLVVKSPSSSYSFGGVSAYTIYQLPDMTVPYRLAIVPKTNEGAFDIYTHENLEGLIARGKNLGH